MTRIKTIDVDAEVARLEAMDDETLLGVRCGRLGIGQTNGQWFLKAGRDRFPCDTRSEAVAGYVLAVTSDEKGVA